MKKSRVHPDLCCVEAVALEFVESGMMDESTMEWWTLIHWSRPRSAILVNSPLMKLCFSALENYGLQSYPLIEMISWAHWIRQCPPHFLTAYACQGCSQMVQLFPCLMLYECVAERRRKRVMFSILPIDGVF